MDGRKRPAAPWSRGNSPPSQRRRQSEQSSMSDRYANTAHYRIPTSPPNSRRNSGTGFATNMQTGLTPYSATKHLVDQDRQTTSRDTPQGPERTQLGGGQPSSRRPSRDYSPRHVASPVSNRSGSNTPVHVAPTVPSMFPAAPKGLVSRSAPMSTLSALRSHKASLAVSMAQVIEGPTNQEVKMLKAQLKASQMQEAQLRSDLKKLEALPSQLTALKNLVEQQQQAAAKGPSPENTAIRLSNLENAVPAVDPARFEDLKSEIHTIKTEAKKLDHVLQQVEQLQAMVMQHGKEIAETSSSNAKLKAEVDMLMSVKEDVKAIKKQQSQGQAVKGDAIRKVAQAAIQPEVEKWEAFRARHEKDVDELKVREGIQRQANKHSIAPADFKDLQQSVCGLGEDKEKLAKDVHEMRSVISELQLKSRTDAAQDMQTSLSDKYKDLTDRVKELETAPSRSASPALSASHEQLKERVEGVCKSQKSLQAGHVTFVDQLKTLNDVQTGLSEDHNTMVDQFKAIQHKQAGLYKDHKAFVDQIQRYLGEQRSLQSQQEAYQSKQDELSEEQTRLKKAVESLESRVTAPDRTIAQINDLATARTNLSDDLRNVNLRVTALETAPTPATRHEYSARNERSHAASSSSRIDDLESRLRSVENHIGGADGLSVRFDKIQNDIEEVEKDVELFQNNFVGIYSEIFDPFKEKVEGRLTEQAQAVTVLQGNLEELQQEYPAATFSAPQLALIHSIVRDATETKPDLSRIQELVRIKAEQGNAAVEELKKDLEMKQDVTTATQAIDVVKAAVRSLQHQYENISTDDLHQKMVHWFTQTYPTPSANMYQQFAAIQLEVAQLRNFTDIIARIPHGVHILGQLAQIGPQLTALVQNPLASNQELLEKLAKTDEVLQSMNDSIAQLQEDYDNLVKRDATLRAHATPLIADDTPFAKAEALAALETSIATLRADLETHSEQELQARKEFQTKASREHDQRVNAESSIKTLIQGLLTRSNEKFKELDQLSSDFSKTFNEFNDPKSKELFAWLPALFLHVGQLQWVLEKLNQILPKRGLEIEWASDWKHDFSVPSPLP